MPNPEEEKAFSLVEVIVAMALLLIIFVIATQNNKTIGYE